MNEKSIVLQIVEAAFELVLLPILLWGIKELTSYLRSKTKNAKIQKYITLAEDAVTSAVKTVSQTYVTSLKEKDEFNEEAQKEAFCRAMELTKAVLTDEAVKILGEAFGDVETYLRARIESTVLDNKRADSAFAL